MALKNVVLFLGLVFLIADGTSASRDVPYEPTITLDQQGQGSSGLVECWTALIEIKSCSNEIVLFFINGHADIGTDCCRAIGIITHNCWPAMITSLGLTAEEGYILRGYCDASPGPITAASPSPIAAASPVAPSPVSG